VTCDVTSLVSSLSSSKTKHKQMEYEREPSGMGDIHFNFTRYMTFQQPRSDCSVFGQT